jgi:hypothetical protein
MGGVGGNWSGLRGIRGQKEVSSGGQATELASLHRALIAKGRPGTGLVPWRMAMNLRVPEELDRRLEQLAVEEHTSKSALLLQGAELVLQRHRRSRDIGEGLDFVMSHDAVLLTRLEDA